MDKISSKNERSVSISSIFSFFNFQDMSDACFRLSDEGLAELLRQSCTSASMLAKELRDRGFVVEFDVEEFGLTRIDGPSPPAWSSVSVRISKTEYI